MMRFSFYLLQMKQSAPWDPLEGIDKVRKYCAYQERCRSDVWMKLVRLECPKEEIEEIIEKMEYEGFLDEGRFARSYVRGHYAIKGWGRIKIQNGLRAKRIPESLIEKALGEIEPEKYYQKLMEIAFRKSQQVDLTDWDQRQKFKAWLLGKGFEYEQIELAIEDLLAGNY
jgi:regulatory protein